MDSSIGAFFRESFQCFLAIIIVPAWFLQVHLCERIAFRLSAQERMGYIFAGLFARSRCFRDCRKLGRHIRARTVRALLARGRHVFISLVNAFKLIPSIIELKSLRPPLPPNFCLSSFEFYSSSHSTQPNLEWTSRSGTKWWRCMPPQGTHRCESKT